jgi:hypothetical protein
VFRRRDNATPPAARHPLIGTIAMTAAFLQNRPDLSYSDKSFQSTTVEVFLHSDQAKELFKVDPFVVSVTVRKSRALELFAKAEQIGLMVSGS